MYVQQNIYPTEENYILHSTKISNILCLLVCIEWLNPL